MAHLQGIMDSLLQQFKEVPLSYKSSLIAIYNQLQKADARNVIAITTIEELKQIIQSLLYEYLHPRETGEKNEGKEQQKASENLLAKYQVNMEDTLAVYNQINWQSFKTGGPIEVWVVANGKQLAKDKLYYAPTSNIELMAVAFTIMRKR
jgi:hypothetical protein